MKKYKEKKQTNKQYQIVDVSDKGRIQIIHAEKAAYAIELKRLQDELDLICDSTKKAYMPIYNPVDFLVEGSFLKTARAVIKEKINGF